MNHSSHVSKYRVPEAANRGMEVAKGREWDTNDNTWMGSRNQQDM